MVDRIFAHRCDLDRWLYTARIYISTAGDDADELADTSHSRLSQDIGNARIARQGPEKHRSTNRHRKITGLNTLRGTINSSVDQLATTLLIQCTWTGSPHNFTSFSTRFHVTCTLRKWNCRTSKEIYYSRHRHCLLHNIYTRTKCVMSSLSTLDVRIIPSHHDPHTPFYPLHFLWFSSDYVLHFPSTSAQQGHFLIRLRLQLVWPCTMLATKCSFDISLIIFLHSCAF